MNRPSHRGCDRVCAAPGITRRLLASTDLGVAAIARRLRRRRSLEPGVQAGLRNIARELLRASQIWRLSAARRVIPPALRITASTPAHRRYSTTLRRGRPGMEALITDLTGARPLTDVSTRSCRPWPICSAPSRMIKLLIGDPRGACAPVRSTGSLASPVWLVGGPTVGAPVVINAFLSSGLRLDGWCRRAA